MYLRGFQDCVGILHCLYAEQTEDEFAYNEGITVGNKQIDDVHEYSGYSVWIKILLHKRFNEIICNPSRLRYMSVISLNAHAVPVGIQNYSKFE